MTVTELEEVKPMIDYPEPVRVKELESAGVMLRDIHRPLTIVPRWQEACAAWDALFAQEQGKLWQGGAQEAGDVKTDGEA
jgi:hypothetical protein